MSAEPNSKPDEKNAADKPTVKISFRNPDPPLQADRTVACKYCRRTTEVCRSRFQNPAEWLLAPLMVPYRCLYCGYRGFALRSQVPETPANEEILHELDPMPAPPRPRGRPRQQPK